ncbi:hypothetical protein [Synechococcus sp. PCC 7335]|uniref:hypothetical protein n=1 Tax=Synechococcus sp. (strain ATCC 29403 / PCC 7335) TaxID=91464 RepID=UPI000312B1D7|nr:hypothetical protein [Synechococcus sp. PCC 7335]
MAKGRPGGNPDIADHGFKQKHDWSEPCTEKMTIRMPPAMKAAIKAGAIPDWQEVCRRAIAQKLGWSDEDTSD